MGSSPLEKMGKFLLANIMYNSGNLLIFARKKIILRVPYSDNFWARIMQNLGILLTSHAYFFPAKMFCPLKLTELLRLYVRRASIFTLY